MDTLKDSIISPMLSSARAITSTEHVKPQAAEPMTEEELATAEAFDGYITPAAMRRLLATVRALQRDLAEARAKIAEAQQLIKGGE